MPIVAKRSPFHLSRRVLAAAMAAGAFALALPAQAEIKKLEIIAPANPGGGWDQTARAMQKVLQSEGLASGASRRTITISLSIVITSVAAPCRCRRPRARSGAAPAPRG